MDIDQLRLEHEKRYPPPEGVYRDEVCRIFTSDEGGNDADVYQIHWAGFSKGYIMRDGDYQAVCAELEELQNSLPKIKADAIRDFADHIDQQSENVENGQILAGIQACVASAFARALRIEQGEEKSPD